MLSKTLPPDFLNSMRVKLGDEFPLFIESFNEPTPVSVRLNPLKKIDVFNSNEKVPWASGAYYLPNRISFTLDPYFQAGCYYVQEASSMFLEQALKIAFADGEPVKVLDLCAAPGGKSTHIASLLPKGSLLVSNEVISSRNRTLQQNISKWGCNNVIITQNEASDFNRLPGYFDVIVIDAPCSGEGLFRKDPGAINEWSILSVEHCGMRQTKILNDAILSLKKDGVLVYSTCTFEDIENDNQIEKLINENFSEGFEKIEIDHKIPGIFSTNYGYQFCPHKIKGEGFYLSMLRRKNGEYYQNIKLKFDYSGKESKLLEQYIHRPAEFLQFKRSNDLYAIPEFMKDDFPLLMKNLYIRQAGIHLGNVVRDQLIPSHQLAQSTAINFNLPRISLSFEESIKYLRGEPVNKPELERGWHIAEYNGFALGWMKSVGARINNYFPKELRVLMQDKS